MKKFLLLAICLFAAGAVSAQGYEFGDRGGVTRRTAPSEIMDDFYRVRVGIAGGVSVSNTLNNFSQGYTTGAIVGFNAGLMLEVPIVYPLSFAPEVLYSEKGYAASTPDGKFTQHANFIDVPLLAKFHLSPYFNLLLGPQIAFPVSTTNIYNAGFDPAAIASYDNFKQKTLFDGAIGFSYDITSNIEIRLRYSVDLQPTYQNDKFGGDFRNQVAQFGLGFKL